MKFPVGGARRGKCAHTIDIASRAEVGTPSNQRLVLEDVVTRNGDPISTPRRLGAILVGARDRGLVFILLDEGTVSLDTLVRELYFGIRSALDHRKWALHNTSYNFGEVEGSLQRLECRGTNRLAGVVVGPQGRVRNGSTPCAMII